MPHLDPDRLVLVALGEQDPSTPEADHLHTCATCRTDLDATRATITMGRETEHLRDLPAPPDKVWAAIATVAFPAASPNGHATKIRTRLPVRRKWRRPLLAAAAIVVVAVAGVAVAWSTGRTTDRVIAEADLTPQPAAPAAAHGKATIVDTGHGLQMRLTLTGMPAATGYYTVWLYDGRTVMIPIGSPGAAPLNLPEAADDLTRFPIVDVSAQQLGQQQHGTSMLQGRLHS